jgi:hypothetical protein
LAVIVLKPRLTAAISDGPVSGSGGGVSPWRAREVAGEHEGGNQQEREDHQRPGQCARRNVVGRRARRDRNADPVRRARSDHADKEHLQPRREAHLGLGAEPFTQALGQILHQGAAGRLAAHRSLRLGNDAHAVLAAQLREDFAATGSFGRFKGGTNRLQLDQLGFAQLPVE